MESRPLFEGGRKASSSSAPEPSPEARPAGRPLFADARPASGRTDPFAHAPQDAPVPVPTAPAPAAHPAAAAVPQGPRALFGEARASTVLQVTDAMLEPYQPLEPDEDAGIRRLARTLSFADAGACMSFGDAAMEASSAASGDLLRVARSSRPDLHASLATIREAVMSVGADEILGRTPGPGAGEILGSLLRRVAAPQGGRLRAALDLVEAESRRIAALLPGLSEQMAELERVEEALRKARSGVMVHVAAAEIALADWRSRTRPDMEAQARSDAAVGRELARRDYNAEAVERRVSGNLRPLLAASAQDGLQTSLARSSLAGLAEGARSTVLDMVGLWKRHCAAALLLLEASRGEGLGAAAGDVLAARDRLVSAIDARRG